MGPSLPTKGANLAITVIAITVIAITVIAITVIAAYFMLVCINRIPQLHRTERILKSTITDNPYKGKIGSREE